MDPRTIKSQLVAEIQLRGLAHDREGAAVSTIELLLPRIMKILAEAVRAERFRLEGK